MRLNPVSPSLRPLLAAALLSSATGTLPALAQQDSAAAMPLSLREAEDLALERNERVLIAREEIERTAGQIREVRARTLPSLDVTYRYARNIQRPVLFFGEGGDIRQISIGSDNDNQVSLELTQTLFSRSVNAATRAARLAQDVSRFNLEETGETLTLDVRRAYYLALLNGALIGVQEQALEQAERRLRQVEQFLDVGTAAEFDRLTAQVEADNIRPLLIEARNDYTLALNELKRLVGVPLDQDVTLTDSLAYEPVDLTLQQARERALVERDDLRSQRAGVQLQQQAVAVEQAQSFPEFSFTFDMSRRASSDQFVPSTSEFSQTSTAGLEIRVPVFDGRAAEGRVRQARAQLSSQELRLSALEQDVELQVQQALLNASAGAERIEATQATVGRAARALEIAETRFRSGLSTQLELNDAELALTQARTTLARALFDHNVARAEFLRAVGER
ncbi:MAG: TolC family protein [Gemmatimonadetes bacterium]|nr:TolC family protein [Gemmatimonadota bacterium]